MLQNFDLHSLFSFVSEKRMLDLDWWTLEKHEKFTQLIRVSNIKDHIRSKGIYDFVTLKKLFEISEKNREPGRPFCNYDTVTAFKKLLETFEEVLKLEEVR
jgi:hypothetical protein